MKNLVLSIMMVLCGIVGYTQSNAIIVNESLPKVGISPYKLGYFSTFPFGLIPYNYSPKIVNPFERQQIKQISIVDSVYLQIWFKDGGIIQMRVKENQFCQSVTTPYRNSPFINSDSLTVLGYTNYVAGINIQIIRIPFLEKTYYKPKYSDYHTKCFKSDVVASIRRISNPFNYQDVMNFKEVVNDISFGSHIFDLEQPFKNILWSGRGYAYFEEVELKLR